MNFVPDHSKAIAEMRRVTRPEGIVSAWQKLVFSRIEGAVDGTASVRTY